MRLFVRVLVRAVAAYFVVAGMTATSSAQSVSVTEFTIPPPDSQPSGFVSGPDGALWFTERTANKLGRITPSGTVTEYALPTSSTFGSQPYNITLGADGALWFTEVGSFIYFRYFN